MLKRGDSERGIAPSAREAAAGQLYRKGLRSVRRKPEAPSDMLLSPTKKPHHKRQAAVTAMHERNARRRRRSAEVGMRARATERSAGHVPRQRSRKRRRKAQ